jgi:hypothetical protein
MKILKIDEKIDFSAKKFKKVCVLQRKHECNFNFQTQLSQKLQRFRACRKNKKCSIFRIYNFYVEFFRVDWSFKTVVSNSQVVRTPNVFLKGLFRSHSKRSLFSAFKIDENFCFENFLPKIEIFATKN